MEYFFLSEEINVYAIFDPMVPNLFKNDVEAEIKQILRTN